MIVATIVPLRRSTQRPITSDHCHRALTPDEVALLDMYRAKSETGRAAMLRLSFQLANRNEPHGHLIRVQSSRS